MTRDNRLQDYWSLAKLDPPFSGLRLPFFPGHSLFNPTFNCG